MQRLTVILLVLGVAGLACSVPATPTATAPPSQVDTPTSQPLVQHVLATTPPIPTDTPVRCVVHTGVPGGRLNLRTWPGIQAPAIAWLHEGDELHPLPDRSGIWLAVEVGNMTGWVNSELTTCK